MIIEQIKDTEKTIQYFPKYEKVLKMHKKILKILLPLDESEKRGVFITFTKETLQSYLNNSKTSRKPIIKHLQSSDFNLTQISDLSKKISEELIYFEAHDEKLKLFHKKIGKGELTKEAIDSIIKEDYKWFENQSEIFGVEPSLLLLIFDSPLRPFFEQVARDIEENIKETWLEPYCAVCGRQSNVARKRKLNRYMICSYCGLEYLVDMFKCINCGNIDPTLMGFIKIREHKDYELNYCKVCDHYIKILDEDIALRKIPRGLEDILTRELDNFAQSDDLHLKRA
jgi:hypothetical protein